MAIERFNKSCGLFFTEAITARSKWSAGFRACVKNLWVRFVLVVVLVLVLDFTGDFEDENEDENEEEGAFWCDSHRL